MQTGTLKNGLRIFALPRRSAPVVELQFWVRAGSADEQQDEHGLAHFHEHTLFKGTETRSAEEIAGAVEGAGGVINAFTSFDATCYHATLPENAWQTGLAVLADMVANPRFDAAELEREIQVVREEIRRAQDEAESLRADALFATRYRAHPYGRPILGTPESVGAFTREKVQAFFRRWYTPANMALAAVGDFDPEALFECAEAASSRPARSAKAKSARSAQSARSAKAQAARPAPAACERSRTQEPAQSAPRITLVRRPFECASFDISWPGPACTHEDAPLLDLLAFILGGAESARLVRRVQNELGLAERACADCFTPADPGVFGVSVDCAAEALPRALEEVVRETERLRRAPVSATEIDTARANFLAMRAFECEGQTGRALMLGAGWALAGDPHHEERALACVHSARPEDLLRVAQEWLQPGGINIAALPGQDEKAGGGITEEALLGAVERGLQRARETTRRQQPDARSTDANAHKADATAHGAGENTDANANGVNTDGNAGAGDNADTHNAGAGDAELVRSTDANVDALGAERAHDAGENTDAKAKVAHTGADAALRGADANARSANADAVAHDADTHNAGARGAKLAHPEVLARSAAGEFRLYRAESGLRIFTLRRTDAPLVSVRCTLPGGQLLEASPQQAGLSAFLAALWMRGTRQRSKADFDLRSDALAALLDGFAERSRCGISLDCTSDKLSPALELFAEALCEPAFDTEEIESERRETLAELARRKDRPGAHVFDLFRRVHYAGHPYRYPFYGTPEAVARFDQEALLAQQAQMVRAERLVIVLVGDIDPDRVAQEAAQRFAGLDADADAAEPDPPKPGPPAPQKPTAPPDPQKPTPLAPPRPAAPDPQKPAAAPAEAREIVETRNCAQAHFVLGFRGLETGDADGPAADLLAQVLAGQAGRLFVEVRERQGLAYEVNAVNLEDPAQGVFLVNLGCAPEKLERAEDAVRGELLRILDTPPAARELESAQNNLVGSHAIDMQHNAFYAACIASDALHGAGATTLLDYPERVRAVSPDDMLRVARRIIHLDGATRAVIRP